MDTKTLLNLGGVFLSNEMFVSARQESTLLKMYIKTVMINWKTREYIDVVQSIVAVSLLFKYGAFLLPLHVR